MLAAAVFPAVEIGLFFAVSRLNHAADETWLRQTLAQPHFYVTEAGMLAIGALTALVVALAPWFLLLLMPIYGFLQQAALHAPLQHEARTDDRTGLLRFEAWRSDAVYAPARLVHDGRPWAVAFLAPLRR